MTDIHKPVSLAGQVFERIEKEILLGGYAYGTILTETQLCKDLGVSRTPVREALFRLEEEHLVRTTPKGVQVLGITEQDLQDIYDVRILLEPLAGKLCCERCTEDEKKEMKDTIELQEFYVQKRNPEQIRALESGQINPLDGSCLCLTRDGRKSRLRNTGSYWKRSWKETRKRRKTRSVRTS